MSMICLLSNSRQRYPHLTTSSQTSQVPSTRVKQTQPYPRYIKGSSHVLKLDQLKPNSKTHLVVLLLRFFQPKY